ncbi:MAG TPA: M1 family aminopeptidase [Bacteroidales bacterium]|nr:M1 family aminopeptidase [Bacteroidales bacterium]
MKYIIAILCFSCVMSISVFSQEYDFFKYSYRFSKALDHENDSRLMHYDIGFYFLNLEMSNTSVYLSGSTRIDLNLLTEYNNELVFDFKSGMTVDSIKINGAIRTFSHSDDKIVINYSHTVDFNDDYMVSAEIFYHGSPSDGMFYDADWYSTQMYQFTYSLSEPYSAKYWFPCKQVLSDKADSVYVYITIPETLKAGSNGLLVNEVNVGGGKKRVEWQSSYPINYYLISVAVGKYQDYSFYAEIPNFSTQILVQNYIPDNATYLNENAYYINNTSNMLQLLSDKFGLYPFSEEKYGHCIVPLNGGMEHQTMTTLGYFSFRLVIHELTHSWFGDYLTCSNWQDIWINEGFASYGEYIGLKEIQGDYYGQAWLEECMTLAKEAPTGSVYVPFEELSSVARVFDYRLSYRKGAYLVHMIRYIIDDDELFFSAMQEYLNIYGHSTASGEDFKEVFENETEIDFEPFFQQWYYGEGYPIYSVTWSQTDNVLNIEMTQTTTASDVTPLFTVPMEFEVVYDDETSIITRENVESNYCTYQIPVTGVVTDVIVNPNLSVLADVSSVHSEIINNYTDLAKVFPNPSNGGINIYTQKSGDYEVKLFNLEGKIIFESEFTGNSNYLDFGWISNGVYYLLVISEEKISNSKIILSK